MGLEKIAMSATAQEFSPLGTPPLSTQNLPDDDQQIEDATSGVGVLSLDQNGHIPDSAGSSVPPMAALTMKSLPGVNGAAYLRSDEIPGGRPASAASVPSPLHDPSLQMQTPGRPHSAMSHSQYGSYHSTPGVPSLPRAGLAYTAGPEQISPEELKSQPWSQSA